MNVKFIFKHSESGNEESVSALHPGLAWARLRKTRGYDLHPTGWKLHGRGECVTVKASGPTGFYVPPGLSKARVRLAPPPVAVPIRRGKSRAKLIREMEVSIVSTVSIRAH